MNLLMLLFGGRKTQDLPNQAQDQRGTAAAPSTADANGGDKELTLDLGNNIELKLVLIPAGKFFMGSPAHEQARFRMLEENPLEGMFKNEGPQHEVTISSAFYLGRFAVTREQYENVMGKILKDFKDAKNPVEGVSWEDACDFCKRLSATSDKTIRLPTEAEWEYACRAGSTTAYCFGDDESGLAEYAWYKSNSQHTHPVGEKKPNAWGLYDMHGNVDEWCQDWYSHYDARAVTDPQGPDQKDKRWGDEGHVIRGGPSYAKPAWCRSAFRHVKTTYGSCGFRVVVVATDMKLNPTQPTSNEIPHS
jgi:formylglycine-generating enzyme required for sulfatase activity